MNSRKQRSHLDKAQIAQLLKSLADWHEQAGQPSESASLRNLASLFDEHEHDLSTIQRKIALMPVRIS